MSCKDGVGSWNLVQGTLLDGRDAEECNACGPAATWRLDSLKEG